MKTPKEIHVSLTNVGRSDILILQHYLDTFPILFNYRIVTNKLTIYFIKDLMSALDIMLYLEINCWKWNETYK